MTPYIYIGIDAGVSTGLAILDKRTGTLTLDTLHFWDVTDRLTDLITEHGKDTIRIYIEDVTKNKPVFSRNVNNRAFTKIAQNVGSVKRDTQLIINYCQRAGVECICIRPTNKSFTKLSKEEFRKITGYTGKSSQHARDAAMILWGR